jgi:hypothetical protein
MAESVAKGRHNLKKIQTRKACDAKIRSRLNWLKFGHKGFVLFFKTLKYKETKDEIDYLYEERNIIIDPESILDTFSDYYKTLYRSEDVNNCMEETRENIHYIIPKKLSKEDSLPLEAPINLEEVKGSIHSMAIEKAPKPDGLPIEFYKINMEWISSELKHLYEFALSRGSLGPEINVGLIKLIPKTGDKTLIKNWTPITSMYHIRSYSKFLQKG